MEKKLCLQSRMGGKTQQWYYGGLRGLVTSVEKESEEESILKIVTDEAEETINVPFWVHKKAVLNSKIGYSETEIHSQGSNVVDKEFCRDVMSPIMKHYNTKFVEYKILVLNGEFKGREYEGRRSLKSD